MFRVAAVIVVAATTFLAVNARKEMFRYARWYAQWR
jgi:hypothetical protein